MRQRTQTLRIAVLGLSTIVATCCGVVLAGDEHAGHAAKATEAGHDAAHTAHAAAEGAAKAAPGSAQARLERLKELAGEWSVSGKMPGSVTYKVTAGGSALVETLFAETPHEMMTVYTVDGNDLVLTHYCADGNQPRMKAVKSADPNTIHFAFTGAGNLKSPQAGHMHEATITFVDTDHAKTEWTYFKDGKKSDVASLELTRKKTA